MPRMSWVPRESQQPGPASHRCAQSLKTSSRRALGQDVRATRRDIDRALNAPGGQGNAAGLTSHARLSKSATPARAHPFLARPERSMLKIPRWEPSDH
eukprot:1919185-Pyramimonas_sp.AAC.1